MMLRRAFLSLLGLAPVIPAAGLSPKIGRVAIPPGRMPVFKESPDGADRFIDLHWRDQHGQTWAARIRIEGYESMTPQMRFFFEQWAYGRLWSAWENQISPGIA